LIQAGSQASRSKLRSASFLSTKPIRNINGLTR
jgi:hypothetical protein